MSIITTLPELHKSMARHWDDAKLSDRSCSELLGREARATELQATKEFHEGAAATAAKAE
jgi:hypothetical protein